jgi:hypothetical protein
VQHAHVTTLLAQSTPRYVNSSSVFKLQTSLGTLPESLFSYNRISLTDFRFPTSVGMEPSKLLVSAWNTSKRCKPPISGGIEPTKYKNEQAKNVSDAKRQSKEPCPSYTQNMCAGYIIMNNTYLPKRYYSIEARANPLGLRLSRE